MCQVLRVQLTQYNYANIRTSSGGSMEGPFTQFLYTLPGEVESVSCHGGNHEWSQMSQKPVLESVRDDM